MRVIFMGTPAFAVPGLKAIIGSEHSVAAVVTGVDKRAGRSQKLSESPVKQIAGDLKLTLFQPDDFRDPQFLDEVKSLNADVCVVVAFRILPPELFNIPKYGSINLHASLLPELRGAAPIHWALMRGCKRTGLTTFKIAQKVDTGLILLQEEIAILPEDDAGTLSERLSKRGGDLIVKTLDSLEQGRLEPTPQTGIPSKAPRINKDTCSIKWHWQAERIHNRVRGLSPSPGAFSMLKGKQIKIFKTKYHLDKRGDSPGKVWQVESGRILVSTGDGSLEIVELQLEGKRRMSATDFLRGYKLEAGTLLG